MAENQNRLVNETVSKRDELEFDVLLREIERYLAAVAVFCAEGCEPSWQ